MTFLREIIKLPNWKIVKVSGYFRDGKWIESYTRRAPGAAKIGPYFEKLANLFGNKGIDFNRFLKGLGQGSQLFTTLKSGAEEFKEREYSLSDLGNAIKNIDENIEFAIENPDALIQASIEGLTSTAAVATKTAANIASLGTVNLNISGSGIQSHIESFVNWYISR